MSKRNFNEEEVKLLLENNNISKCSKGVITFSSDFKLKAVNQYKEGLTSTEIFKQAGLDLDLIGKDTPKGRLRDWNKIFKSKGILLIKKSTLLILPTVGNTV